HLSTLLCGQHRRDVLRQVRERLRNGERCHLVATQVIEAGVDVDFPLVLRALGPLDAIIQAAGRCNREGLRKDGGRVVVFAPVDGGLPQGAYQTATGTTRLLLAQGDLDVDQPATVARFYQFYYPLVGTDTEQVQQCREALDYPETAKRARLIKDE